MYKAVCKDCVTYGKEFFEAHFHVSWPVHSKHGTRQAIYSLRQTVHIIRMTCMIQNNKLNSLNKVNDTNVLLVERKSADNCDKNYNLHHLPVKQTQKSRY